MYSLRRDFSDALDVNRPSDGFEERSVVTTHENSCYLYSCSALPPGGGKLRYCGGREVVTYCST